MTGRITAGHPLDRAARRGEALRVFTGGLILSYGPTRARKRGRRRERGKTRSPPRPAQGNYGCAPSIQGLDAWAASVVGFVLDGSFQDLGHVVFVLAEFGRVLDDVLLAAGAVHRHVGDFGGGIAAAQHIKARRSQ